MISFDAAVAIAGTGPHVRLIAIDGLPVSGKSTLAERIAADIEAECIYLDDFVRPEAEWRSRARPGFPFDYIRYDEFLGAVKALARDGSCSYRLYDWNTGRLGDEYRTVRLDRPVIVEGVSALHPELAPLYDLRFWIESDAMTTLDASLKRGVGGWEREWRVSADQSARASRISRRWTGSRPIIDAQMRLRDRVGPRVSQTLARG